MTTAPPHDWQIGQATWATDVDLVTNVVGSITAFADAGSGRVTVTSVGHGCLAGMYVRIIGTTNYNGSFVVYSAAADSFVITVTWVADDATGTWQTGLSGNSFILFENTTPANDPFIQLKAAKYVEVEEGYPVRMDAVVQADSVAATHTARCGIWFFDADKTYISQSQVFNDVLTSAGEWLTISGIFDAPDGARYATPYLQKNNTAFHLGLDTLGVVQMPIAFSASLSSNHAFRPTYTVIFDTEQHDYGSNYNHTTGIFTAPMGGLYSFSATGTYLALADTHQCYLSLVHKNSSGTTLAVFDGPPSLASTNAYTIGSSVSAIGYPLSAGDYVYIVASHSLGVNATLLGTSGTVHSTYFTGAKVE